MVSHTKRSNHSIFKKCSYPLFAGNIVDYYQFKSRWNEEVVSKRLMEISELNNHKDQILQSSKNKLYEVCKLSDAWKILDELYGD